MANQHDINGLIRRAFFLLGLELAITGGIALGVMLDIVFR
jgi:hypothetical protein